MSPPAVENCVPFAVMEPVSASPMAMVFQSPLRNVPAPSVIPPAMPSPVEPITMS